MSVNINDHLRHLPKSRTLLINEVSRQRKEDGDTIYKFGFGESPFTPHESVVDALRDNAHLTYYPNVEGMPELRNVVADWHNRLYDTHYEPENILVSAGSKILLFAAMAAFKDADILIPTPSWVSYDPQARMMGLNVVPVETGYENRWMITPETLDTALQNRPGKGKTPAMLILNYPSNPTGQRFSGDQLIKIADVLHRHNAIAVSDEIYGVLDYTGKHESLGKYYPEGTLVTGGLSKWAGGGGWRIGIMSVPDALGREFKSTVTGILSETVSAAPAPMQEAAKVAFAFGPGVEAHVKHQRRILKAAGSYTHAKLVQSGIRVHPPQGGFYVYVDFSPKKDALAKQGMDTVEKLCAGLLDKTGVALLPSTAFGGKDTDLQARLAFVDFDGDAAMKEAANSPVDSKLGDQFLMDNCPNVVAGIDALADWFAAI